MSMWVNLVQVSPELLGKIVNKPAMLDAMLFDEGDPGIAGFDGAADVYGEDYRHMFVPYFEFVAEQAGGDPDDFESCEAVTKDPMYRAITGGQELEYEFCYGPASYNDNKTVRAISDDWDGQFSAEELANESERPDIALFLFCKKAAEQGRAVICGIS